MTLKLFCDKPESVESQNFSAMFLQQAWYLCCCLKALPHFCQQPCTSVLQLLAPTSTKQMCLSITMPYAISLSMPEATTLAVNSQYSLVDHPYRSAQRQAATERQYLSCMYLAHHDYRICLFIVIIIINDHRICWDAFEDPESGVASYSYQIFQLDSPTSPSASPAPSAPSSSSASSSASSASRKLLQTPSATPVTPQITLDASSAQRAQLVTGLGLHYGSTYYAQITATNNADLNTTSSSTYVAVAKAPSNRSLLIAIVVLASIGVSMLLVACLTAFIVRRR